MTSMQMGVLPQTLPRPWLAVACGQHELSMTQLKQPTEKEPVKTNPSLVQAARTQQQQTPLRGRGGNTGATAIARTGTTIAAARTGSTGQPLLWKPDGALQAAARVLHIMTRLLQSRRWQRDSARYHLSEG